MDYKSRHEEFVSGLTGSPLRDIYEASAVVLAAYLSWVLISNKLPQDHWITVRSVDFFLNWVAPLLITTVYNYRLGHLVLLVAFPPIFQRLVFRGNGSGKSGKRAKKLGEKLDKAQAQTSESTAPLPLLTPIPFLTAYRASMLILTMIAILAVDFRIFPRKLAKVETWGTSLMDLGVGSFVFSNGLTSARPLLKRGLYGSKVAGLTQMARASGKILSLGIIRLVGVKLLNYQEHVTEYGVHWNFFITLGVLPIFLPLFQAIAAYVPMVFVGLGLAIGYEIALKNTGLMEWVLTAERTGLLSQNKEGLCSTVGFMAIFLIGQAVGYFVLPSARLRSVLFPPRSPSDVQRGQSITGKVGTLLVFGAGLELLFRVFRSETMVSRRLANLPYVLWVCSYNTFLVAAYALISIFARESASASMVAVNKRGQTMFLVSNVCTGLVNMLVRTIDAGRAESLAVLVGYCAVLYGVAYVLTARSVRARSVRAGATRE